MPFSLDKRISLFGGAIRPGESTLTLDKILQSTSTSRNFRKFDQRSEVVTKDFPSSVWFLKNSYRNEDICRSNGFPSRQRNNGSPLSYWYFFQNSKTSRTLYRGVVLEYWRINFANASTTRAADNPSQEDKKEKSAVVSRFLLRPLRTLKTRGFDSSFLPDAFTKS